MIQDAIRRAVSGESLGASLAQAAMGEIMDGRATPAQIAGLVAALRTRGERVEEVAGFARAMRRRGVRIAAPAGPVGDTCGTGGDGAHTLNISTAAALIAAGAGLAVAKHGNRAASSRCGSADVLEALGVRVDADAERVQRSLREARIAFCFAPVFHPAMRHAGPPRRELGVRTIFNLLGPLCNPAGAGHQVIGVAEEALLELEAGALAALGTRRSLVVHSGDGLDELTTTAPVRAIEVHGRRIVRRFTLDPRDAGFKRSRRRDLAGGSPADNAAALRRLLDGERSAFRDSAVLTAGVLLHLAGLVPSLRAGMIRAAEALDAGRAQVALDALRRATA